MRKISKLEKYLSAEVRNMNHIKHELIIMKYSYLQYSHAANMVNLLIV